MEKYTVKKVVLIDKDSDKQALENPYYQLTLANKLGDVLTVPNEDGVQISAPIRVSQKFVNNLFKQEQVDMSKLTDRQAHRLVKTLSIEAVIEQKLEGDDFVATENSNLVNVGTSAKPKWESPVVGQTYKVQESGYRVDYDHDFIIEFDDELADNFVFANAKRIQEMQEVSA